MNITMGSLFDGSGTFPLAAQRCGITPVWASEIEPFPIRVTKKNFPDMIHLGDITQINGAEIPPVDIISGGSPCQDISICGKKAGIKDGERSKLFFEMIRVIREMREKTHGEKARIILWENVPNATSSQNGRDFLTVLQSFAEIAEDGIHVPLPPEKDGKLKWQPSGAVVGVGFSIAWRVMDAQYFGVPQRRRRLFLIAQYSRVSDTACAYNPISNPPIGCAGKILFEQTRSGWNHTPSGRETETPTADTAESIAGHTGAIALENHPHDSRVKICDDGIVQTLPARMGTGGGQCAFGDGL